MIPEGGTAHVYVTRDEKRKEVLDAFRASVPGVSQVIAPGEYAKWGYPKVTPNGRMADLVLAASNDYAFDGAFDGPVNSDVPPAPPEAPRLSELRPRHARHPGRLGRRHQARRENTAQT